MKMVAQLSSEMIQSELKLDYQLTKSPKPLPDQNDLSFGKHYTDHMLCMGWDEKTGWQNPIIKPLSPLQIHPASSVLHYAFECFEGMKAYVTNSGKINLFRPEMNGARLNKSSARVSLPEIDSEVFLTLLKKFVEVEKRWVPTAEFSSLYLRPTHIGNHEYLGIAKPKRSLFYIIATPSGPYVSGSKLNLFVERKKVRAFKGGFGDAKLGANYGPSVITQNMANEYGCQQVLWLNLPEENLAEAGAMNIFVTLVNENDELELATPTLDGTILPGITRDSILVLARKSFPDIKISERTIPFSEILKAHAENRLVEMFAVGTAAIVVPVDALKFFDDSNTLKELPIASDSRSVALKLRNMMMDIQYGDKEHPWIVSV